MQHISSQCSQSMTQAPEGPSRSRGFFRLQRVLQAAAPYRTFCVLSHFLLSETDCQTLCFENTIFKSRSVLSNLRLLFVFVCKFFLLRIKSILSKLMCQLHVHFIILNYFNPGVHFTLWANGRLTICSNFYDENKHSKALETAIKAEHSLCC